MKIFIVTLLLLASICNGVCQTTFTTGEVTQSSVPVQTEPLPNAKTQEACKTECVKKGAGCCGFVEVTVGSEKVIECTHVNGWFVNPVQGDMASGQKAGLVNDKGELTWSETSECKGSATYKNTATEAECKTKCESKSATGLCVYISGEKVCNFFTGAAMKTPQAADSNSGAKPAASGSGTKEFSLAGGEEAKMVSCEAGATSVKVALAAGDAGLSETCFSFQALAFVAVVSSAGTYLMASKFGKGDTTSNVPLLAQDEI